MSINELFYSLKIGITGEMYIAGYSVGKGYLNKEKLTNEKFIECPFNNEKREKRKMHRTGDLGRWLENGEIEYLGRIDFQVKIHGQRIELNEIENTIKEINSIKYCAVIDKVKENGDKYLIGYYISEESISGNEIRSYLKQKLPVYMIPNYFQKPLFSDEYPVVSYKFVCQGQHLSMLR
ncbi:acetyl-CoA synthetase-like protein [Neocallimastix californiae]|uniref:Acetyl-CoA synthetase-like protein n=1 Tax=Neocallimastix californiae TaxID=1754190 RepID=A0A1Y1XHD1_9FUNG|nr:acetyl-CoA synthetase-like protein [Neocallimastix californiae]|eukprot:ORX85150.1 acetyl-CoA synthetase-like protein [Neocallimastix californiae]